MRIAAWVLTIAAAAATLWLGAMAEMIIVPGLGDPYYSVAAARSCFPVAAFALANGAAALLLADRPPRPALWLVLAGALLALVFMAWQYRLMMLDASLHIPDYSNPLTQAYRRQVAIGRLLFWPALGATALGWLVWFAAQLRPQRGAG
jgi:hypothetical protein